MVQCICKGGGGGHLEPRKPGGSQALLTKETTLKTFFCYTLFLSHSSKLKYEKKNILFLLMVKPTKRWSSLLGRRYGQNRNSAKRFSGQSIHLSITNQPRLSGSGVSRSDSWDTFKILAKIIFFIIYWYPQCKIEMFKKNC